MAPLYDLIVMLDTQAPDDARAKVLTDVQTAIAGGGGSVERDDDWGVRQMAYEIRHKPDAEYHLLQFTGPPTLIEGLQRSLRINDAVVRHRVIKLRPGTPEPPQMRSEPPAAEPAAS